MLAFLPANITNLTLEILGHKFDKDSSVLLYAINSFSTGGFLKKTRLYSGFKNKNNIQKNRETRKLE
jgi:hypothetical protein